MTAAIPIPSRILALIGIAALVLVGLLVARPLLAGNDSNSSSPVVAAPSGQAAPAAPTGSTAKPAAPRVVLLKGVPHPIASKLMHSRVTVVSVYSGTAKADHASLAQAKAGARAAGVPFVAVNVLNDKAAAQLQAFGGSMTTPTVLIVKRPGKIVAKFESVVDDAVVQQAAYNARGGKK